MFTEFDEVGFSDPAIEAHKIVKISEENANIEESEFVFEALTEEAIKNNIASLINDINNVSIVKENDKIKVKIKNAKNSISLIKKLNSMRTLDMMSKMASTLCGLDLGKLNSIVK